MSDMENTESLDFIRTIVAEDIESGKHKGRVETRFPPEPNGYLHIGHAKAFCLDFGVAAENGGVCHLRFDDTNPEKEDTEYIDAIKEDIRWMGFDWGEHLYFASDYFERLYGYAVELIKMGRAYVDSLSAEEIREYRGTLTEPGKNSPYRDRSIEENLELFEKMKNGEFKDGEVILRAKIDMASPNLNMRDPAVYRVRHVHHHRTGDKWCIYPMYDFTHCLSDAIENITHSLCTLEFENHRPLYDWFLEILNTEARPRQIEFARLNLTYTMMSKRKLLQMVEQGVVDSWDDPRMPTLAGFRRRGFSPEAIRDFVKKVGIAKVESTADYAFLEFCLREDLNQRASRKMVVLDPLKVVIDNYPEGEVEWLEADNNQEDPNAGKRKIPFSKVLYIEQEDFKEVPPRKYHRLYPGNEIRLKHAYYIKCESFVKDEATGEILEVHCTYDPKSKGGWTDDGRKVKGTSHWVSASHSVDIEVREYDHLFTKEDPSDVEEGKTFMDYVNPESLNVRKGCKAEPGLAEAKEGEYFQFLRQGYFVIDNKDSSKENLVFNRSVNMRDSWAKMMKKMEAEKKAGKK